MANIGQKEDALNKRIQETESVLAERRRTTEVLCSVLEEYNQLITLLNKRVLYLDHLVSVEEAKKHK